jgi:hypothetical protein
MTSRRPRRDFLWMVENNDVLSKGVVSHGTGTLT